MYNAPQTIDFYSNSSCTDVKEIRIKRKKEGPEFFAVVFFGVLLPQSALGQASSPCETEGRQRKREAKVAAHTGVKGEGEGRGRPK